MTTEPSTETRDWDEVRKAAIRAVIEAASDFGHDGLVAGDAEKLTDAVLAVCDEEAVNRMAQQFVEEARLISLGAEDGRATLHAAPAREIVAHWVMASRGLLADAENYVEIDMEFPDRPNNTRYAFTLQKVGKHTPHQMRKEAEARAAQLEDDLTAAEAALGELAGSHRPDGEVTPFCLDCGFTWPCSTRRILDKVKERQTRA